MCCEKQIYKFPGTSWFSISNGWNPALDFFKNHWSVRNFPGWTFVFHMIWWDGFSMRPKGLFLGKILKEAGSKQHILGDVTHSEKNKKQFIVLKYLDHWNVSTLKHSLQSIFLEMELVFQASWLGWKKALAGRGRYRKGWNQGADTFWKLGKAKTKNPQLIPSGKLT